MWNKDGSGEGGFKEDPRQKHPYGPHILMANPTAGSPLEYFEHFMPMRYLQEVVVTETNSFCKEANLDFNPVTLPEIMVCFGIIYSMTIIKGGPNESHFLHVLTLKIHKNLILHPNLAIQALK